MIRISPFLFALALAGNAAAQVHKCVDAGGKVSYSESPCAATQRGSQVLGRGATEPVHDPYAAERTMETYRRASEIQRSTLEGVTRQSQGPAGAAAMGRQPSPRASRQAAQDVEGCETISNRKGCIGGERGRNPNWSPRRGYFGGGGPADQRYEAEQRQARQEADAADAVDPRPSRITNCAGSFCYDQKGKSYMSSGSGNLQRSDGKTCTPSPGIRGQYECR